ncbi:MAG: RluA family pseudouridine synthase [Victivallales bacterium]
MKSDPDQRIAETLIEPEAHGLRLDFYLQRRFSYRSRTEWQKSIEDGEILLNGRRTKSSRKLQTGEKIAFIPKPYEEPAVDRSFVLLEENEKYLTVSKPGNLPCHPAGVFFRNTLWHLLRERYGETVHIATRLDRETSGVVLVARTPETAAAFTRALTETSVHKRYIAIVHGNFPTELTANGWLSPDPSTAIRKKRRFTFEQLPESERSETSFRLLKQCGELSVVEAIPRTGRLHQIRATLFSLGYPMTGDKLYGVDDSFFTKFIDDRLTEDDRNRLLLPRQALHASELRVPFRGGELHASAPLPDDMAALCGDLSGE